MASLAVLTFFTFLQNPMLTPVQAVFAALRVQLSAITTLLRFPRFICGGFVRTVSHAYWKIVPAWLHTTKPADVSASEVGSPVPLPSTPTAVKVAVDSFDPDLWEATAAAAAAAIVGESKPDNMIFEQVAGSLPPGVRAWVLYLKPL